MKYDRQYWEKKLQKAVDLANELDDPSIANNASERHYNASPFKKVAVNWDIANWWKE